MPGRDRKIDPVTRDYIKDGQGGYETTTTIATQLYHQIAGKRGHWWGDKDHGSDLHLVREYGAGEVGIVFATDAVKTALARFISEGLARDLRVEVGAVGGRIAVDSSVVDIQGAEVGVDGVTAFAG